MQMREVLKTIISYIAIATVAPLAVSERIVRRIAKRDVMFESHGELLSLMPGKFGRYLRNAYYSMTLKKCPLDCCFMFGMSFTHSEATVGHRVYIGAHSMIGIASIGDDTLLGDHVQILSGKWQHTFHDPDRLIQEQPQVFQRIYIGGNSWIGTNSVAMADIGKNCVIGAGSVVTRAISEGHIAAGNPARVLRSLHKTYTAEVAFAEALETAQNPSVENPRRVHVAAAVTSSESHRT
jgi:virginiamycin A acetyltransferase